MSGFVIVVALGGGAFRVDGFHNGGSGLGAGVSLYRRSTSNDIVVSGHYFPYLTLKNALPVGAILPICDAYI